MNSSAGISAGMQRDDRAITRLAMAHDASHFLLTPTEVVRPSNVEEVSALLREAVAKRRPLTFRAAGTSLCGQAVTDATLVDVRRHFQHIEVLDDGLRVRAGAGTTLAAVNAALARYGRRLGPDPTSAMVCTIGGIVANNSSGMLAGATQTAYHTLDSMVFVLTSGRVVDTAEPAADITLRLEETELIGGLHMLRKRLRTNRHSLAEINRLFALKNTMGYAINALTQYHRPVDIISHLLVGSEGTLGFVAEATFRTVPLAKHNAAGLLLFSTLTEATTAATDLAGHGFEAIELLDVAALRVVQSQPDAPAVLREATLTRQAALLIELHEVAEEQLEKRIHQARQILHLLPTEGQVELTEDPQIRSALLKLRRGLYAMVAGSRTSGTTTLLEDICVPLSQFSSMCEALDALFDKHGYSVLSVPLFAHARDGNIHFLLSECFDESTGRIRYRKFSKALAREVLARRGVLKAEHGTGRAMAPFLRAQYGDELYDVMREIKHLFDPAGVLNPGVIITDDPNSHLSNLKLMPTIEPEVDRCIECGFCETVCPSRDLTLTPRQRIVLRRELAARSDDEELLSQIDDEEYTYAAVETCTTGSMCALACPVGIDTGDLVRLQRAATAGRLDKAAWNRAARSWGAATKMGSALLTLAGSGRPIARAATKLGRKTLGADLIPVYGNDLPSGASLRRKPRRGTSAQAGEVAAYFPSCLQSMFGTTSQGLFAAFHELCHRAEISVRLLDAEDLCCGAPWYAKGLQEGYATMRRKVAAALSDITVPVISDAGRCTAGLQRLTNYRMEIIDVVEFAATTLLPRLPAPRKLGSLALHPTCGSATLGINDHLLQLAEWVADEVVVPQSWSCCGFAGDRGLLHPEVTASATSGMADELAGRTFDAYASLNRTCEIAMSRATGKPYVHILEIIAAQTREG